MSHEKELQGVGPTHCPCLSVIMPAYNEEATLTMIVERVIGIPHLLELVIVDDCSSDKTGEIAKRLAEKYSAIEYVRHDKNKGKTEALKKGFAMAKGDVVIVQDADLEYDPNEIQDVISPILHGHADVVYGSRFMVKKATRILYFTHYLANKSLTFFSNCFTNLNMSDMETCYKAFRSEIARNMIITSSGFGFEVEVTAKIAKLNAAIYEVPISYYGRTYDEGKKIGFKDGVAALFYVLKYNLFVSKKGSFQNSFELAKKITQPYLTAGETNE
ncbi:MAG: glycosyltransferase family 2 protein [Acidobacteria bacterium]|nr:glycosyltransferase family 2 protein [Acidobacteriota bacterium]